MEMSKDRATVFVDYLEATRELAQKFSNDLRAMTLPPRTNVVIQNESGFEFTTPQVTTLISFDGSIDIKIILKRK